MTAGEIVDRIKKNLGAPWRQNTYRDTFKSGGPDTPVTGIATTVFVTMDMLERAVAAPVATVPRLYEQAQGMAMVEKVADALSRALESAP